MKQFGLKFRSLVRSKLVKNSFWGFVSTAIQTAFLSLFFVVVSRHYPVNDFSNYLIATTIYQFVAGLSSMGLGTWFIREYENDSHDRLRITMRFLKIQARLGLLFYLVHVVLICLIYPQGDVRILGLVLGMNIVFDNLIYGLTNLNVAKFKQKRTAIILAIDALLRFVFVCFLFIWPFSILFLSACLVVIRLCTVGIFLRIGISKEVGIRNLWRFKVSFSDMKKQVIPNWRFVVIVGLSMMLWRAAPILISKFLGPLEVAYYEVAFKVLSLFIMLPVIASATIYPQFVKLNHLENKEAVRKFYQLIFGCFSIVSIVAYAFVQSYADIFIPYIFGGRYANAAEALKELFLTFLIFPTALLQANLLVSKNLEHVDLKFNLVALLLFFAGCFTGLYFFPSLSVINYSLFISFLGFHVLQSIYLCKLKITSHPVTIFYYATLFGFVIMYHYGLEIAHPTILFILIATLALLFTIVAINRVQKPLLSTP